MAIQYGVLRARPDRYKREDNASTPHLQIRALETSGQPWRIAVNVQSDSGSDVAFWVVDPLAGHPLLASLPALRQDSVPSHATRTTRSTTSRRRCSLDGRSIAAAVRQREQRRPAGPAVAVSRPVQGCRRRDLRVRREVRSEPAHADRRRVRQHGRSSRHSRHPPEPGQCRAAQRRQRRVSRRRIDPEVSRSISRSLSGLPDAADSDRRRGQCRGRRDADQPDSRRSTDRHRHRHRQSPRPRSISSAR